MVIKQHTIKVEELIDQYVDNQEDGVFGYHGKLNIRPPYQRELVYDEEKQKDVIRSILNGFPLNVMYFMKNSDGSFELLDGQQRTLSICRFCDNQYPLLIDGQPKFFHNLGDKTEIIKQYPIEVYFCEGTNDERKKWFEIINFKGEALTKQELLNAIYSGPWVTDAKRYFSKSGCAAYQLANDYLYNKSAIRQEIFETALKWIADRDGIEYEEYMAAHEGDENAEELFDYFKKVIKWVKKTFGCPENYRPEMRKVNWGVLYNRYGMNEYNSENLEDEISKLMGDYEISRKEGIYEYVFDGDEKHLNLRKFDERTKRTVYEQQDKKCFICGKKKPYKEMHGDHWIPWSQGGTTVIENCKMLCAECNLRKSAQQM